MNPSMIIAKKRDGMELQAEEIREFIENFSCEKIPDYQMSALAMAIFHRGMSDTETAVLTEAMLQSGITLPWDDSSQAKVDKHSTGGIGDKVSIVLSPLLACCGLQVPMLSGRGLGPTGGTLDKLESIPGFRTDLNLTEIQRLTQRIGCVITGASNKLAPADRKLYALRDVTATVPSIPLITASIMSKKLAENLDALVLDVKIGSGAFMKTLSQARLLANSLVQVGRRMNVQTTALITDMNQPLGRMVGNGVEINESIDALRGEGPTDLMELTFALSSELMLLTNPTRDSEWAHQLLIDHISSGRAYEKFREMVTAQGGDLDASRKIASPVNVPASRAGYIGAIDTESLGYVVIELGGGRKVQSDSIDHSVGLEMLVRLGDEVESGQPMLRVFAGDRFTSELQLTLQQAITITDQAPTPRGLIVERID